MLRINPTSHASQAKSYYSQSDYYTEDQELPGVWCGKAAQRLGLQGTVEKEQFEALCDNLHPTTGERITQRTRSRRTIGYDFNFHAPKSVTLLHAISGDNAVMTAFQQSVDETMQLIEADMQARVRKDKVYEDRTTGEMVWGRFDHLTSRPVGGIPDPHLHSHCFVLNMTFDGEENQWKAGQFRNLKRDAPFYQSVFHSKLAAKLTELGYPVEKTPEGWDVAGVSRATLDKFSRRTTQINELAREKGIESAEEKAALGAKTREGKAKNLTMSQLREEWRSRLTDAERSSLTPSYDVLLADPDRTVTKETQEALQFACQHLFERHSVVSERQLLGEMLSVGLGRFDLAQAQQTLDQSDVMVREHHGQRLATTREVLAEEERLIAFARQGRGRCASLGSADHTFERDWLNAGQKAAVHHVLTSHDRVMMIRGAAGAGKTSLMQEAVAAIESGGKKVFTFAPSADASRGVLRQEGFENADTVARLLVDPKLQEQTRGQVLWVDEAGLLGAKSMGQLFNLADRLDCRVILSGDRKQHGSVERGAVLRILEQQAGIVPAEVKEIQRQKGEYKQAVELLSEGQTEEGFDKLDAMGWIQEVSDADRYQLLAADYVAAVQGGRSALVVSPTHAEGAQVTETIREALRAKGRLEGEEHAITTLKQVDLTEAQRGQVGCYRPGDVLQFHQNAKGFPMGSRFTVGEGTALPVDQATRFQVYKSATLHLACGDRVRITKGGQTRDGHKLENGSLYNVAGFTPEGDIRLQNGWVVDKNYGHLTHGYVTTSHAAQGKTVDQVLLAQSGQSWGAASREQFYVSASRGRQKVMVYTDDKEALREAITQSDARLAATELFPRQTRTDMLRQRLRLDRMWHRVMPTREADSHRNRRRQEVEYERG